MTPRRALGLLLLLALPLFFLGPLPASLATPGFGLMGAEALKLKLWATLCALLGMVCIALPRGAGPRAWARRLSKYPRAAALAIGLGMTLLMLALVQILFLGLNTARGYLAPALERDPLSTSPTIHDTILGYRPRPGEVQRDRMLRGDTVVYDVSYTIDARSQRIVPASAPAQAPALVFFGRSYTYGVGCEDDETLPNQVALRAPGRAVYNLAYGGYGPHQMLAMLEQPSCVAFAQGQAPAVGIYVFIRRHVRRVVPCVPLIQRPWVRLAPCYQLDASGALQRLGLFPDAIPWRVAFYDFLGHEQVRRFLNIHYPLSETDDDLRLTAKIVRAAAGRFTQALPGASFHVLLYPSLHDPPADAQECGRFFAQEGLAVIDLAAMFADNAEAHTIPGDGHPTPATHAAVATALVEALNSVQ